MLKRIRDWLPDALDIIAMMVSAFVIILVFLCVLAIVVLAIVAPWILGSIIAFVAFIIFGAKQKWRLWLFN